MAADADSAVTFSLPFLFAKFALLGLFVFGVKVVKAHSATSVKWYRSITLREHKEILNIYNYQYQLLFTENANVVRIMVTHHVWHYICNYGEILKKNLYINILIFCDLSFSSISSLIVSIFSPTIILIIL